MLGGQRRHGPVDGIAVAAVAVHEHDAARPVRRTHELDDHVRRRDGADGERAGEPGVLAAGGDGEGRADDRVRSPPGEAGGERLGDERVSAERQVRAVLLARPDRHADERRRGVGEVEPGAFGEQHGCRPYCSRARGHLGHVSRSLDFK
jgi:hypothetical protein